MFPGSIQAGDMAHLLQNLLSVLEFLRANPAASGLFVYLLYAVILALFKPRTDAEYEKLPRWWAATLKFMSATGLDPVKLVEVLVTVMKLPKNAADGSQPDPTHVTNNVTISLPPGPNDDAHEVAKQVLRDLSESSAKASKDPRAE